MTTSICRATMRGNEPGCRLSLRKWLMEVFNPTDAEDARLVNWTNNASASIKGQTRWRLDTLHGRDHCCWWDARPFLKKWIRHWHILPPWTLVVVLSTHKRVDIQHIQSLVSKFNSRMRGRADSRWWRQMNLQPWSTVLPRSPQTTRQNGLYILLEVNIIISVSIKIWHCHFRLDIDSKSFITIESSWTIMPLSNQCHF